MSLTILHLLSTLCTLVNVLGGVHGRSLSSLNQPFTIKIKSGQVYDCVDFYKQPAFSNSMLKNHASKVGKLKANVSVGGSGVCPSGTVPILRTNENNSFDGRLFQPQGLGVDGCIAVIRTRADRYKKFYGAEGSPSLNKPATTGAQWSAARMKLSNGSESIEVGWMVSSKLFGDEEAHLYVRFEVGPNSCINTYCPGFVQVNQDIPLGVTPDQYSQYGGQQLTWRLFIDKHHDDGNWWVSTEDDRKAIGYWPNNIFSDLVDAASRVEWGGEISNPGVASPLPEMGYGEKARYNTAKSAFYQHVTVVDERFDNVNPQSTEKFTTCPKNYNVLDWGYRGDYWGRLLFYGGPN